MNKNRLQPMHAILLLTMMLMVGGCRETRQQEIRAEQADSVIFQAGSVKQYKRMMELTDSFEVAGSISALDANRWRGVAYYRQGQYGMAEMCYRKALESKVVTKQDQLNYNKVARRLSEILLVRHDFEGSLRIAIPAVKKMEATGIGSDMDFAILLNNIGCCQLNLGRDADAQESFLTAREHYANRWKTDSTSRGFQEAVLGTVYTSQAYINTKRYAESIYWIDRTEMLLNMYRTKPDARKEYFDEYQGRIEIMRAVALEGLKKTDEAAQAYSAFLKTNYSKTAPGQINATDYLMVAGRYKEATLNYRHLSQALSEWGMVPTLDNIQLYMLPKYRANVEAGRRDSAQVVGRYILSELDEAISKQVNSTTAELATIYDTQGKDAEIARQQVDMAKQRLLSTGIALVLLITFFLIYTLNKRKAAHKLAAAHRSLEEAHANLEDAHSKLQSAYDELEKTTKAKERIESELRIARDIQMSMVPNIFPDAEGIDLYAAMLPAKEVGGDLYGYLLQGKELYFCVGDVSGKGVPASLFMAQATRLFRTLAAQHMKPAEIANQMNAALTENNEQGMFITMFIGFIDLSTGHMDYCNAGHNPPIIGMEPTFLDVEPNAPIGIWEGMEYVGESLDNIMDIPIFVYSDGLNEAENAQQEQLGDERVLEFLRSHPFTSSKQTVEMLKEEVEKHRAGAERNDDLTMLSLRVTSSSPGRR